MPALLPLHRVPTFYTFSPLTLDCIPAALEVLDPEALARWQAAH